MRTSTGPSEGSTTAADLERDPVGLEILWSRLIAIADEMAATVLRTAVSPVIGSAQDFGCELLDATGSGLSHATRSMPVFNLVLPEVTRALLAHHPVATMGRGDVWITNDPWLCAGHLDDIAAITPIFRGDRVIAFACTVAHASSIGGVLDGLRARDLYEEGFAIPLLKLHDAGRPNETLLALLAANVRQPEMVLTDVAAQVAANEVGAQRLLAFLDDYGLDGAEELAAIVQGRAEGAMRRAIAAVPDGVYRNQTTVEGAAGGGDLLLQVEVTIAGDEIAVDYSGSSPQQAGGGINCTLSYTRAHTVYPLKCLFTPGVPSNEGCFRPIHVRVPEGSVLNARRPASVNARTQTGWHIHDLLFGALDPAMPERVQAGNGLMHALRATGHEQNGTPFGVHFFTGGGRGAGGGQAGLGSNCFPSSAGNVPVEVFEARAPILVDERTLLPGTEGGGLTPGTPGHRFRLRRLPGSEADVRLYLHPDRLRYPARGRFGGGDARLTRVLLNGEDLTGGTGALDQGEVVLATDDDVYTSEVSGGGGMGTPEPSPEWLEGRCGRLVPSTGVE